MKIGLVSQEYPPESAKGGIGTQTLLKAAVLTERGHDVRVISRSATKHRSEKADGSIRVIRIPCTGAPAHTELADWLAWSHYVAQEVAAQHAFDPFDILDFPEWACEGYAHLLNQTEWNHIPTVIQLHGPLVMLAKALGWPDPGSEFFRIGTQMEAATLRLADAVYSSSACSAEWCAREYGLDRQRIPVLHSGVDTSFFRPSVGEKAKNPTIVFVGKLVQNKGVETLVEAACSLASHIPNLRLRLLGTGEEQVERLLRTKVSQAGLDRMLEMHGRVDRQALVSHLNEALVLAAPSLYEGGPGFVYLEAMACGLPVIGCAGSGAAEVIRDGDTGFLIEPNDSVMLAETLQRLLANPGLRETMGQRARAEVIARFDSRRCIAEIELLYRNVIAEAHSGKRAHRC